MTGIGAHIASPAPPGRAPVDDARQNHIRKTARDFESVYLGMVVNEMLQATAPSTMNGGHGEEMFRSVLGNEIGKVMAENGGVGIAHHIERALGAYK